MSAPPADPAPRPRPLRVIIVEDRRETRDGLAALIDGTPGYECVGRFASMEEALSGLRPPYPDVALLDIGLPAMSGIDGVRHLRAHHPGVLTVMLTVYDDDERIFEAMCAGAYGYLLKKTPPARLLDALSEVVHGGAPMSPEVARRVVALFRDLRPPRRADYALTPHEIRLLKLLIDGHNYRTAAAELDVSVHTISFHLRQIYGKLQVHSKTQAVAKALRHGLL